MEETKVKNPFIVGKYLSDKYFCDREAETEMLRRHIENGRNVVLVSPRRLGKSGLIHHFFSQDDIRSRYYVFFVDIYATSSLAEFVYSFGKAVYETLKPQSTVWKEKFFQVVASLRVGFKLDPLTGQPGLDLGLGDIQSSETTLDEIFDYLAMADKPCIVAIDEFQQIQNYGENNVEALLRTKIQQCSTTQFIFAGSKRHVMSTMFNSPAKPFYQSAVVMGLGVIPMPTYAAFANRLFEDWGRTVDTEVAESVWKMFEGYTWFVQMMMNELFALTPEGGHCCVDMIATARQNVIMSQEDGYKGLLVNIPSKQKVVLQAIAKEGVARNITSAKFIRKYNINSASSVQAAVKLLMKGDVLTQTDDGGYRVYDFFFSEWLATRF